MLAPEPKKSAVARAWNKLARKSGDDAAGQPGAETGGDLYYGKTADEMRIRAERRVEQMDRLASTAAVDDSVVQSDSLCYLDDMTPLLREESFAVRSLHSSPRRSVVTVQSEAVRSQRAVVEGQVQPVRPLGRHPSERPDPFAVEREVSGHILHVFEYLGSIVTNLTAGSYSAGGSSRGGETGAAAHPPWGGRGGGEAGDAPDCLVG